MDLCTLTVTYYSNFSVSSLKLPWRCCSALFSRYHAEELVNLRLVEYSLYEQAKTWLFILPLYMLESTYEQEHKMETVDRMLWRIVHDVVLSSNNLCKNVAVTEVTYFYDWSLRTILSKSKRVVLIWHNPLWKVALISVFVIA